MTDVGFSAIPHEARPYQGAAAGVATRLVASVIDGAVVGLTLVSAYAGYAAIRLMFAPRSFRLPDASPLWTMTVFLLVAVVYLTMAWRTSGRTYGNHLMGIRVLDGQGAPPRLPRALGRAVLCVAFPIGLLWCAGPSRRSLPDLLLRTSVVYDWLPGTARPPVAGDATSSATSHDGQIPSP